ncbi:MAG: NAD(P)-binding domain-containing protein, partial [Actinomycetota bacterium]
MTTSDEIAGETDLAVVGCGPTGIAALFQAGIEGIEAVGIETGPAPLSSVRDYMSGLVLISRPRDYEVAGIPLDCKDLNELTREEVLHYFGRVINYGRLDIRCREECLDLVPTDDAVLLRTTRGTWRANRVLVTGWYRKRPTPETFVRPRSKVTVLDGLHDPISVAGKRTAIIGGGLSACEHAAAIMIHGQSIKLFSRHRLPSQFRTRQFETLVRVTRSVLVEGVGDLRLEDKGISYRLGGDGPPSAMPC